MIIFNEFISNPFTRFLALSKSQNYEVTEDQLSQHIRYALSHEFLWHPDFIYLLLLGSTHIAKLKAEIREDIPPRKKETEERFSFPLEIKDGEQLYVFNFDEYYPLNISAGTYRVMVDMRSLTYEEIEDSSFLMAIYGEEIPISYDERPCNLRITFCRCDHFRAPMFHLHDQQMTPEIRVLDSNLNLVLLEDSGYEFD